MIQGITNSNENELFSGKSSGCAPPLFIPPKGEYPCPLVSLGGVNNLHFTEQTFRKKPCQKLTEPLFHNFFLFLSEINHLHIVVFRCIKNKISIGVIVISFQFFYNNTINIFIG